MEKKVCLILDAGNWGGGEDGILSKGQLAPLDNQWERAFIDRGRGLHAEIAVSSDSHLEIGHWWSDQHHLDCFKYS